MPTLNYNPTPSVSATESTSGGFQTQRATPRAFGSDIGEGLSALGQRFEQAGDVIAKGVLERQTLFNQVAADDASNKALEGANKLLYGDPDDPSTPGYYQLKGEAAMRALPEVRKKLDDLMNLHRGALQNPNQQLLFNNETRRSRLIMMSEMGRHYDRESNRYTESVYTGQRKLAEQDLGRAAANDDDEKFKTALETGIAAVTKGALFAGKSAEEAQAAVKQFTQNAIEVRAEGLMAKDAPTALKFLENHQDELPPEKFLSLKGRVETKAREQIVTDVIRGRPSSNLIRGGAAGKALDYATIKQYALDAGFRGEAADIITAITFPESGGNPNAHNPKYPDDSYGLTQINALAHGPKAKEALGNPKRAMELAFEVSKGGTDFRPWTTFTSGAYKQYLSPQTPASSPQPVVKDGPDQLINVPLEPGEVPDSEIPGLPDVIKEKLKDPRVANDPKMQELLIKRLRQEANAAYSAQQRSRTIQNQMQADQDRTVIRQYQMRMRSDSPNVPTEDEIKGDTRLSAEGVNTAIGFLRREFKPETEARVSAQNQRRLFERMQPDYEGDDKVTSERPINEAYIKGELTRSDREALEKDLRDIQDPTGPQFRRKIGEVLKAVEPKLLPMMVALGKERAYAADPTAAPKVAAWKQAVEAKIAEYQAAGKNPNELFKPGTPDKPNPDYVGGNAFLSPWMGKLSDRLADPKPGAAATLDSINKMSTLAELQAAASANPRLRDAAMARALELGLVRATPSVPMAR